MVKQASHSFAGGMLAMAVSVLGAGVLALVLQTSPNVTSD
jgi:amino acid permease